MLQLELSENMVAVIGQALGLAPYNVAAPVIAELQKQIDKQKTEVVTGENGGGSIPD